MAERAIAAVRRAEAAAAFLGGIGEHKCPNDVRRVCHSNATYRSRLQVLHRDNMELRQKLQAPS